MNCLYGQRHGPADYDRVGRAFNLKAKDGKECLIYLNGCLSFCPADYKI